MISQLEEGQLQSLRHENALDSLRLRAKVLPLANAAPAGPCIVCILPNARSCVWTWDLQGGPSGPPVFWCVS